MTFGFVAPPYGALWRAITDLLTPAVERGGNDWGEVIALLDDGRAQLWLTMERDQPIVAAVSRMDGDTFEVWLAGGRVLSRLDDLEMAITAAREGGATNGRIIGRKGWARVLRAYGWRVEGDELVKDWANV